MKRLKLDSVVATSYTAMVETFEPLGIVFFCPNNEPSLDWLNHSAHDFRRDSAHYRACSFSIVKPGVQVITIEPDSDSFV
jgi:hypothetical protein